MSGITNSSSTTSSPSSVMMANVSTTLAAMVHHLANDTSHSNHTGNATSHGPTHNLTEGGFLSGRNPFNFMPAAPLPTFMIQLVIIVCMARFVKIFLNPIRQPAVIAETISGIILGPTVMGHIPHFSETIFPKPSLPFLGLMAHYGLVLFLFLVGLELDPRMLKRSIRNSAAISLAGMALPFALGCGVSYVLYTYIEPENFQTGFTKYFLFLGVAMAITAFPVLARILTELNLLKTKVGSITISAAAVDDATSWCLLALVISLINAGSGLIALYVFLMGLGYSLFLVFVLRPIFIWVLRRSGAFESTPSITMMFLALMIVWVSAFITDAIGIHAIFGGFLAGIIMPHEGGFAFHITQKIEDIISVLFLPLYFALSGLRTSIGSLNDAVSWGVVALVISVACLGKIVGCTLAAKVTKLNWRESLAVGCLMNCKGLVELIVLNLGYDAQVISQRTFAIMVIMALVTTFATVPLVSYIYPPQYRESIEDQEKGLEDNNSHLPYPKKGRRNHTNLLLHVNRIEQVAPVMSVVHLLQAKCTTHAKIRKSSSNLSLNKMIPGSECLRPNADKPSVKTTSVVNISALRLIEMTDRNSAVMLQTSQDALKYDPVIKLLKTYGGHKTHVQSLAKVVPTQKFGETLIATAQEVKAKYILVPWSGSGSIVEVSASAIQQILVENRRRQSIHTNSVYSNFIQDLLSGSTCTVLIFVDRGLPTIPPSTENEDNYQQIYFPFFGGPDDREALQIVMALVANPYLQITVIRYKNTGIEMNPDGSIPGDVNSVVSSEDSICTVEEIAYDPSDDMAWSQFSHGLQHKSSPNNVICSQVESTTPLLTSLQFLTQLTSSDIVIVGKGNTYVVNSAHFRNADAERRKVLGDKTETILLASCEASVLVVQTNKLSTKL